MSTPNEYTLVEKPILDTLTKQYGYRYIHPSEYPSLRARENEVLFRPLLVQALVRINDIPVATAQAVYNDLASISDNQRWTESQRCSGSWRGLAMASQPNLLQDHDAGSGRVTP